jgi:hypothetical protein
MKYISFGFRCSVASILKELNLKPESYPFDWLISRLHVIKHCIETDFTEFLNIKNYEKKHTNTYCMKDYNRNFICDEYLNANMFYQPEHLQNEENTYQYYLAMNHHNIFEENDYSYYMRSIERLKKSLNDSGEIKYIHFYPLIFENNFNYEKTIKEIVDFDNFIFKINKLTKGLFIILLQQNVDEVNEFKLKKSQLITSSEYIILSDRSDNFPVIHVINTNSNFIDAGSIFMGNCERETEEIKKIVLNF